MQLVGMSGEAHCLRQVVFLHLQGAATFGVAGRCTDGVLLDRQQEVWSCLEVDLAVDCSRVQ